MSFGPVTNGRPTAGSEVQDWQTNLKDLGYPVLVTGQYDDATWSATVQFKQAMGLPADGVVDAATREAMGKYWDMQLPPSPKGTVATVVMDPLEITGRVPSWGWALGLVAAAGVGYYLWRS